MPLHIHPGQNKKPVSSLRWLKPKKTGETGSRQTIHRHGCAHKRPTLKTWSLLCKRVEMSYQTYLRGEIHKQRRSPLKGESWLHSMRGKHAPDIPLIGFWIHRMPPIRWGDWPSILTHWLSLPSPQTSGASTLTNCVLTLTGRGRWPPLSTCHTTCWQASSL